MKDSLHFNRDNINLYLASALLPSLLLPIRFSSLFLILASLFSIYNFFSKKIKSSIKIKLLFPFLIYFLSAAFSFFLDIFFNKFSTEFLLRNVTIIIIPLFIFSSNFSKKQIKRILINSSILISFVGFCFSVIWVFSYYKYNNQQEFQKQEWFKEEITFSDNYLNKKDTFQISIPSTSEKPSIRKVAMLSDVKAKNNVVRELIIKVDETNAKDTWVLIRNVNDGNCKVWFNITNGKVGKKEGKVEVSSEKLKNGFYKIKMANIPDEKSNREWFYISFVSDNGSYSWNNKEDLLIKLLTPKFYLSSGKNLLQNRDLFDYKITDLSSLQSYAHSTYFGLIFLTALVILIFTPSFNYYVKMILISLNIFVVIFLASKAILMSLIFLLPIYYFYNFFNYKYLFTFLLFISVLSFNSHINERFKDMFTTISKLENNSELGDLASLSTNNRVNIFKNYLTLIKENLILGYGFKNGNDTVKLKYNYTFNAHNQYFQVVFNSGLFGFFALIFFCVSPFLIKQKKVDKNHILNFLVFLLLFNFLFESLLFRQWGLILVSLIFSIFLQYKTSKE